MDAKTSRLIIDFLLRQLDDDQVLARIIAMLPLPDDNFQMKKALLLRRTQTELNHATVSEKLLDLMELVCELDFCEGRTASGRLKAAYCAVAVDCTVRFLEDFEIDYKYIETLRRLWRIRFQKIVLSENSELISEQLWSWKDDLEAAVYDVALRGKILARNTRYEALKAVKAYLEEAWHDLGPSYLETVAEDLVKMGEVVEGEEDAQDSVTMEDVAMSQDSVVASNVPVIDGYGDTASSSSVHVSETWGTAAIPVSPAGKGDGSLVTSRIYQNLLLHGILHAFCGVEFLWEASAGALSNQLLLPCAATERRWSPLEEDTLRSGVSKFGVGNWKQILDAYPDEFQGRTEHGLKERYRSMMPRRPL